MKCPDCGTTHGPDSDEEVMRCTVCECEMEKEVDEKGILLREITRLQSELDEQRKTAEKMLSDNISMQKVAKNSSELLAQMNTKYDSLKAHADRLADDLKVCTESCSFGPAQSSSCDGFKEHCENTIRSYRKEMGE